MTREDEELTSRLRWLAQVRICETKIVDCHNCEFHGTCTDPDSDESIAEQIAIHTEAADAIERLSAENAELREALQNWHEPHPDELPKPPEEGGEK